MKTKSNKNLTSIADIANYFGGIPKLASALGIDRHAVYQWKKIPAGRAYQIEIITKGRLKAKDILHAPNDNSQSVTVSN